VSFAHGVFSEISIKMHELREKRGSVKAGDRKQEETPQHWNINAFAGKSESIKRILDGEFSASAKERALVSFSGQSP
jgi:hypothetical protein